MTQVTRMQDIVIMSQAGKKNRIGLIIKALVQSGKVTKTLQS
jgi:hypothetical protein